MTALQLNRSPWRCRPPPTRIYFSNSEFIIRKLSSSYCAIATFGLTVLPILSQWKRRRGTARRTLHDIVCQLRGGAAANARVVLAVGRPCAAHITAAAAITCMNTLQVHGGVIIRSRRLFQLLATWLRIVPARGGGELYSCSNHAATREHTHAQRHPPPAAGTHSPARSGRSSEGSGRTDEASAWPMRQREARAT